MQSSGLAARDRAHVHARAGPHERAPLDPRGVALELGGVEAVEAACQFGLGARGRRHTLRSDLRSDLFTGCPVSSPSRRHHRPLDRLHACVKQTAHVSRAEPHEHAERRARPEVDARELLEARRERDAARLGLELLHLRRLQLHGNMLRRATRVG